MPILHVDKIFCSVGTGELDHACLPRPIAWFIMIFLNYLLRAHLESRGQNCGTLLGLAGTPGQGAEFRENPGKSGTVGNSVHELGLTTYYATAPARSARTLDASR